jgi:hypothetical protein
MIEFNDSTIPTVFYFTIGSIFLWVMAFFIIENRRVAIVVSVLPVLSLAMILFPVLCLHSFAPLFTLLSAYMIYAIYRHIHGDQF